MHAANSALALFLCSWLPAQEPELEQAQSLLEQGAVERALQVLDAATQQHPEDVGLQHALARGLERFVDGGGSWLAMNDARDAWDRALALRPEDSELERGAIAVRLRLGEYEQALTLSERAIGRTWLLSGSTPAVWLEFACRARLGLLRERSGEPPELRAERLRSTWAALEHARSLQPGSAELVRLAVGLLESEGLVEQAVTELVAAIEHSPAEGELHSALVELFTRAGVEERLPALYQRWSGAGTNATLAWYTGYAWRLSGDLAQRERRFPEALEAYEHAGQWMGVASTLEPSYRATAETIRHQAEVSSGFCELESGALEAAGRRLLERLRAEPLRRGELDGLGRSLMDALAVLGERRAERSDFQAAADEARSVLALLSRAGAEDGTWWNNLGFLLREYATQVEAGLIPGVATTEPRAREIFRESWQAYRRAAELLGTDARVLNDAALVQVYHLRDNLAEAETLLQSAIEQGARALAALGPNPPERERFPLAQALGDAQLNLGYLCYHVYRQPERARAAFEQALASDSGAREEIREYLRAIDGQRGPVSEPDRGAFVAPPGAGARDCADVPWEASLPEALGRARTEGRALLVYHRGEALGLRVASLDQLVTSTEFVRQTAGAVLLLSDAGRRTFVDRRRDGRRLCCPQFGTVTCSEHIQAFEEWRAWLDERLGESGESAEGLWLLWPETEELEHVGDPARLAVLERASAPLAPGSEPFEAIEASVGGGDGSGEARSLLSKRSLSSRLAIERILWEGFRSSPARGFLLAALAEDASPSSCEILAACVRQTVDPDLARAALSVWPPELELSPVEHAERWALEPELRAAATEVLRRGRPADPRGLARAALARK